MVLLGGDTVPGIISMIITWTEPSMLTMVADSGPQSFRDLVRNHNRFLVGPLQWTSHHLDLVGCRFEDVATPPVTPPTDLTPYEKEQQSYPAPADRDGTEETRMRTRWVDMSDPEVLAINSYPDMKRERLIKILVGKDRPFAHTR